MQIHITKAIKFKSTKYKEDVMRALITTTLATIATTAPVAAFAAGGRVDDSGIFVWVFLGFCALIVVAQVIPAVLLMTGMVKGVASVVKEEMATAKK
jgi:hypothetical protein